MIRHQTLLENQSLLRELLLLRLHLLRRSREPSLLLPDGLLEPDASFCVFTELPLLLGAFQLISQPFVLRSQLLVSPSQKVHISGLLLLPRDGGLVVPLELTVFRRRFFEV